MRGDVAIVGSAEQGSDAPERLRERFGPIDRFEERWLYAEPRNLQEPDQSMNY